jgi:hypothetical protein
MAQFKSKIRRLSKYTLQTVPATQWGQQGTAMLQMRKAFPKKVIKKKAAAKLAVRAFKASTLKQKQAAVLVRKANQADARKFRLRELLRLREQERRQSVNAYNTRLRNAIRQSEVQQRVKNMQETAQTMKMEQQLNARRLLQEKQAQEARRQLELKLNASQSALNQRIANVQYQKRLQNLQLEKKIANAQLAQTKKAQAIRREANQKQMSQALLTNAQQLAWNSQREKQALLGNRAALLKNVATQKRLNQADLLKTKYMQRGLLKNKAALAAVGKLNAQSALALQLATASAGTPQITKAGLQSMALQPSINARRRLTNQIFTA